MITKRLLSITTVLLMAMSTLWAQNGGYYNNDKFQNDLRYYYNAMDANPIDPIPPLRLSEMLLDVKKYGTALELANIAARRSQNINDNETECKAHNVVADVFVSIGDTAKAIAQYDICLSLDAKQEDVYNKRGNLYIKTGDYAKAEADYQTLLSFNKSSKMGNMGMGRVRNAQCRWDEAIEFFNNVLRTSYNNNPAACLHLAVSLKGKKEWDLAVEKLIIAADRTFGGYYSNDNDQMYFDDFYDILNEFNYQEETYEKVANQLEAKAKNSYGLTYYKKLCQFYYNGKSYKKSIECAQKVLDKEFAVVMYYNILTSYTKLLQYDKCVEFADMALAKDSTDAMLHYLKADALRYMGKLSESLIEYDKNVAYKPYNSENYYYRAQVKAHFDKLAAIDDYSSAIAIDCTNGYCYLFRGRLYKELGMEDMATRDFNKCIELGITYNSNLILCYAYQAIGQNDKAIEFLNLCLKENPKSNSLLYNAACVYSIMNQPQKAIEYLEKSLELGYDVYSMMLTDLYLDPIRDLPEYKTTVEKCKTKYLAQFEE